MKLVADFWNLSPIERLRQRFISKSLYKFQGKLLRVEEAAGPTDVIWENAGTSRGTKVLARLVTNIVTIGLLFAGFMIAFFIQKQNVYQLRLR